MKKFLTLALALAMVLTFSVSVFAASENVGGESGLETLNQPSDINVTVGITTGTATTIYRVDIEWSNVDFVYHAAYSNNWNPTTHIYETEVADSWNHESATVTVTNHSNAPVAVSAVAEEGNAGVDYTFVKNDATSGELTKKLASAASDGILGNPANADNVTYTLTINDDKTPVRAGTIATIKITLADATVTQ